MDKESHGFTDQDHPMNVHELRIRAFMDDPDAPHSDNPIHSTEGGLAYGYRAALVGGVDVYGWGTRLIRQVIGDEWLENGWVEVNFRRPTYPGNELTARLTADSSDLYRFEMDNEEGHGCLTGYCGSGKAPWLNELRLTNFVRGKNAASEPPCLTLDQAPVGQLLTPMAVDLSKSESKQLVTARQLEEGPLFLGTSPRVHPAILAGQMTHLLHHSYSYGPAIHASSHIQNLDKAFAGQQLVVTGYCQEAYERKGHHYIVNDGSIWSETGKELVRLRHKAIFQVAKRGD